ncbi:hypothetical protein SAMN04489859_10379 [Paracoccus alcaliphilus]|uniref:Uncharacterized protein n=1 Tax=Paracoccus alcaliphilus TaxID=34002 RepID=A0A1H8M7D4_9RHOB|nr:hypothetical protein [Paracoccus alcaliphilus]WCR16988.1 hypothetical protein JHW40_11320 [Paracoccus alcaliphilus]SEO13241.1 hypothetical protein SAMN04489859_10379 [Paracoccus alcaliphilus]
MTQATEQTPEGQEILDIFHKLDSTKKLIFLGGFRGLSSGVFTVEQFQQWVQERFDRHDAGEKLTVADLELPKS